MSRVCAINAVGSDARNVAPSLFPTMSGLVRFAATMRPGCSAAMTPTEKAPSTSLSAARTAAVRSPLKCDSIKWASVSVSVSLANW